jgi:hypothetical protein
MYLPPLLETGIIKSLYLKPVLSMPLPDLNGVYYPLQILAYNQILRPLPRNQQQYLPFHRMHLLLSQASDPPELESRILSLHTNLFPTESRDTNEPPVKSPEPRDFDSSLKKPPSQESVLYISSYHVSESEAHANHEPEKEAQSEYSSIKPYFLDQPSYLPFHEIQTDTPSEIRVEIRHYLTSTTQIYIM